MNNQITTSLPRYTKNDSPADIYLARLMSPTEVQAATSTRTDIQHVPLHERWMLCGDVGSLTFPLLATADGCHIDFRVTAFSTPSQSMYAILTHQVEDHQHRMVLPLFMPKVFALLTGLQTQSLGFLLGNDGGMSSAVFPATQGHIDACMPLLAMTHVDTPPSAQQVIGDLPRVISKLCSPDALPGPLAKPVRHVSISVVPPELTAD